MLNTQSKAAPADATRRQVVLTAATIRAADHLGVQNAVLAAILGVSVPTISRMKTGAHLLAEGSKPFELAQLFLRMFRSLDAIVGSDDASSQSWMRTENLALNGKPIDLVQTVTGLVNVVAYLDSRRAII